MERSSRLLKITLDKEALHAVARRSRGTPRIANHLLRFVRDYAQMKAPSQKIDSTIVESALKVLAIDTLGLDEMDKKILRVIIEHYDGGPVGLNTLSTAIGEEGETIEEVYEPYLILQGLIKRTARGRMVTPLGFEHLKKDKLI